jgi:hypothetical protein
MRSGTPKVDSPSPRYHASELRRRPAGRDNLETPRIRSAHSDYQECPGRLGQEVAVADRNAGVLEGKVAVVTGASSGLGQATALALGQAGADVALLARSAQDLERTAASVRSVGRQALVLPVDLAREDQILAAVDSVVRHWRRVDILVNAAATDVPAR